MPVNIFRTGKQYVGWKQIVENQYILGWAAKWLFSAEHKSDIVTPKEAKARDDRRVVESVYALMKQADFVITHNGDAFDIKMLNWFFIKYNLPPNNVYRSIDTIKEYKKVCRPPSYALDFLAQELGYSGKIHTDITLWDDCEAGKKRALKKMNEYNVNDVYITEDIYLRIRGWMKTHPRFDLYIDMYRDIEKGEYTCPRCLVAVDDFHFSRIWRSPAGYAYRSGNCPHCGAVLRMTERQPRDKFVVK
jgi:DNA polymerase III alpha subunit (gram-positive type)